MTGVQTCALPIFIDILRPHLEAIPFWIMHNGMFDEKGLAMAGLDIPQSFDTMGAQYALDETSRKDLGFMAQKYLSAPEYKDTVDKSKMREAPLADLVEYGAKDSDYTYRLWKVMSRQLSKEGLSKRLYHKLLLPAAHALSEVSMTGLPLSKKLFHERRLECEEQVKTRLEVIHGIAGREINPRSVPQLASLLYDQLGLPVLTLTPRGAPSTNEDTLKNLQSLDDKGVVDAILEFRKWDGYRSRYFDNWSGIMDGGFRLHSNFKPFHTVTGRLSSEHPNVQQIPRDTFIRGIVTAPKGWVILESDYSQIELRLAAHYSQDPALSRIFLTGRDPHTETAIAITGLPLGEITKEIRKKAKAVNFGFLYGMGYRKFVQYCKTNYGLEVSDAEAKVVRQTYFDTFRKIQPWHERQRRAARQRGWVISSIGRKRHLWDISSTNKDVQAEAERQAINSPVQSLASDMMLMSMIILNQKLDPSKARIISTVHDSLLFEVRIEALKETIPIVREVMENLPLMKWFECELTVPIAVEIKVGKHWSEGAKVIA